MSEPDASGRQKVVINEGSEYLEDADVVILALDSLQKFQHS